MDRPVTRSITKSVSLTSAPATTSQTQSSKIPFRPKKIRKLSTTTTTTTTTTTSIIKSLSTKPEIDRALTHLRNSDPLLAKLINIHKPPFDFSANDTPFLSLTRSIISQQLSTKAAKSIYTRFLSLFNNDPSCINPEAVLTISAPALREIGLSGRKSSYIHDLAEKFRDGLLSNEGIVEMGDDELVVELTKVKGIGVWTVHMFMIFNLRKPDVLPVGDLGVRKGVQCLYGLKALPNADVMESLCENWRPFRSVGSWYMWRLVEANAALAKPGAVKKGTSN